jgi:uncharacterized protein (TIGR00159 family)
MPALFADVGVSGVVDILLMTLLIYSVLVLLKRTKRAALVLAGILIVALVYLAARQFNLLLTVAVLQGFFAVILVALVVIFQEELRYLFELIAQWGLGRKLPSKRGSSAPPDHIEIIARTVTDLAEQRIGALLVLRGEDLLVRHLDGGETLNGEISEALLKSLFDPHSIGHDGAVIISSGRIERFGCHLPLSKNRELLEHHGTRHAAALGLSERTDALCLVVSEERGQISVARFGKIRRVAKKDGVPPILAAFFGETTPERDSTAWRRFFTRNLREKLIAVGLAVSLWFVLVHEAAPVYRSFRLPVKFAHLPPNFRITRVEPSEVEVTLSAPRKSMYFVKDTSVGLAVRTWDLEPGRTRVAITASDVLLPQGVVLENIKPREVEIEVDEGSEERIPEGTTARKP